MNGFKITNSEEIDDFVYDIEVEDNHNFFVDNVLVHNCIADIFITTGKKRYTCRVWDNEGVRLTKPKKKVVGLDLKRSDTPTDVRIELDKLIDVLFKNNNIELVDFIDKYQKEYRMKSIDDIAIPKGVSDIDKYQHTTHAVPIHVRASKVLNELIDKHNLLNDYQKVVNGDKIKMLMLKEPNTIGSNVIAFKDSTIIKKLDLVKYIDWSFMFQRTFLNPVTKLTDAIGFKTNSNEMVMDELF